MYRSSLFLAAALVGTTVALIQPMAVAKSPSEIKDIARAVTVEIKLQKNTSVGSGVIIDKKGDLYTIVTNKHVVCGNRTCAALPAGERYSLGLVDGQKYSATATNIKLFNNDLDVAVIQFRSSRNYKTAKVAAPGSLKTNDAVYTAGFPFEQPGFTFGSGDAIAVVNKRLAGDNGGYTIVYDALTLPGMSGGGVFNANGQLVAIHGQGDRIGENTEISNISRVGNKIGSNRGIPIRWLVQNLGEIGINLGNRSVKDIKAARQQVPESADEYFIAGFNKLVDPGANVAEGKRLAIQNFSKAIQLNPQYALAYLNRATAYKQVQEFQKSLVDYNQVISLNPKFSVAYYNRALLKQTKLNDMQGALADYNQAISINPKLLQAYYNRAILKADKLNDMQGALADYNQAISINPKLLQAYYNRALLKADKLNDMQGALADYNQAISINPKLSQAYYSRAILKKEKLNDLQGSLSDYNRAISISPEFSKAYGNRGILKYTKLNDKPGGIADIRQAAKLARAQGDSQVLQVAIGILKEWGVSE
jgi:tetratricopeptide (TPR) repeat protein